MNFQSGYVYMVFMEEWDEAWKFNDIYPMDGGRYGHTDLE
jgi:hypothetical protein